MSQCWSVDDDTAAQAFDDWNYVLEAVRVASQCRIGCDAATANAFPIRHWKPNLAIRAFDRARCSPSARNEQAVYAYEVE